MTKAKAAPAADTSATPEAAPAAAAVEAQVVTDFGALTVLSHNTMTIVDNTDVVEDELFQPGKEVVAENEVNGFKVIEYK